MLQRCNNPNNDEYHRYAGNGITVCERWSSFENFYADMGDKPEGTSLDRIDSTSGYTPNNCRWATYAEQSRNTKTAKRWFIDGVRYLSLNDAAKKLGVDNKTVHRWCEGRMRSGKFYPPKYNCYSELVYER